MACCVRALARRLRRRGTSTGAGVAASPLQRRAYVRFQKGAGRNEYKSKKTTNCNSPKPKLQERQLKKILTQLLTEIAFHKFSNGLKSGECAG